MSRSCSSGLGTRYTYLQARLLCASKGTQREAGSLLSRGTQPGGGREKLNHCPVFLMYLEIWEMLFRKNRSTWKREIKGLHLGGETTGDLLKSWHSAETGRMPGVQRWRAGKSIPEDARAGRRPGSGHLDGVYNWPSTERKGWGQPSVTA